MVKVFLEYDESKCNYKIVAFVGSEMVVLDGDDVRVPPKFRCYNEPIEPKVDDDWFGATLPSGEEIDINLFRDESETQIYASVYPVDEDGHIDTAHPILACDEVSYVEKKFFTGWLGRSWLIVRNQSQVYSDGNVYSEGYSLYTKGVGSPLLRTTDLSFEYVGSSYTVEDLVERFIFKEV